MLEKMKETGARVFTGKITVEKKELWMIGAICLLTGIIIGIRRMSRTHGMIIGSNNRIVDRYGDYEDCGEGCCCGDDCCCGEDSEDGCC